MVKKIGITGGIGSGKSYICRIIAEKGFPIYDCDQEARLLMTADPVVREQLTALLGSEAYTAQGELNKPFIAAYLFQSPQNAQAINSIVHPRVKAHFLNWAQQQQGDLVFIESAIFKEAQFTDMLDAILLVSAPTSLRLRRAMQRDHSTPSLIRERMSRQLSQSQMRTFCTHEIINDETTDIHSAVEQFIELLGHPQPLLEEGSPKQPR